MGAPALPKTYDELRNKSYLAKAGLSFGTACAAARICHRLDCGLEDTVPIAPVVTLAQPGLASADSSPVQYNRDMATQTATPVEDFLAMPDLGWAEYLDGKVVERPVPTWAHNRVIIKLSYFFARDESRCRLYAAPTQHISVTPSRYRVPDFVAYADASPGGEMPATPPLIIVEILSPNDSYRSIRDRFAEYANFGVKYIYLADPVIKGMLRYENESLLHVDSIDIPSHGFLLPAADIFE